MPRAHCPRCGATYHSPTISPNGPVCRYCIASGLIVVLLPVPDERVSRRFSRAPDAEPDRASRAGSQPRRPSSRPSRPPAGGRPGDETG